MTQAGDVDHPIKLPSLSASAAELTTRLTSGLPSMRDVGDIIIQDPPLANRVLQLVNSPLYGYRDAIDNVHRATALLGVREIYKLVLAAAVPPLFPADADIPLDNERFWNHSLYCALIARGLAERRHQRDLDRFFLAGLLHDIGLLLLAHQAPTLAAKAIIRADLGGLSLLDAERETLAFTHFQLGGRLLRHWGLPEPLALAVEQHENQGDASRDRLLGAITRLADRITNGMDEGDLGLGRAPQARAEDWDEAGIADTLRDHLIDQTRARFPDIRQTMLAAA